jgi:D-alanine-D-alanine ligase
MGQIDGCTGISLFHPVNSVYGFWKSLSPMQIGILFNVPRGTSKGEPQDFISEEGILEEVEAVERSLKELGYTGVRIPLKEDVVELIHRIQDLHPALIFNLCESFRGESLPQMNIAGLLELLRIPYTGSGPLAIGLSQDKALTKGILSSHKIPVPKYQVISTPDFEVDPRLNHSASREEKQVFEREELPFPLIVKPLYEDASLGITNQAVVSSLEALQQRVCYILARYQQPAIVEEYIEGREINAAVFGNAPARVLPLSEIDFSRFPPHLYKICSYEAKWMKESFEFQNAVPICPAALPTEVETRIVEIALKTYRIMGCRDYARIDLRLDATFKPYVIEVNTNPDISPEAGFTRSILKSGRTYTDFIRELLGFVWERSDGSSTSLAPERNKSLPL